MTDTTPRRNHRRHPFVASCLALAVGALVLPAWAQNPPPSRCSDDAALPATQTAAKDAALLESGTADPRTQLQELVERALNRSKAVGAVRLLAQAAEADLAEAKAQRMPTVTLGVTGSHVGTILPGNGPDTRQSGLQGRGTLSVTAPIYDSGRITKLTEWRAQLAEAARFGTSNAEEQLALQTVSLALDRGRYQLQAQVYTQYVRKMACLVEALDIITKADRGRASELVQAQKSLQQADLSYEQTVSALRQTEVRLKRFVGDDLPRSATMSTVLARLPDLNEMLSDVMLAPDVAQAAANAQAQRSYAESVRAGQQPSVSLLVTGAATVGQARQQDWVGGVQVNIPIVQPGADSALTSARRRAQAASLQRDDTIEAKRYRVQEMYEAAQSSMDRSRRIVDILRNSDRVRGFTLQQWQQLGKRSLFDVMAAEGDYYSMRIAHVNALYDAQQVVAIIWSQGRGVVTPLR
ncbi:TolC family protein [Roseateles amylovorans]|uniref:TolC family protein n=1 Tax=Roseateles amylovorans TaxID=2978473 RepID=A0ABY6AW90_9BURK|nr:TolC family protein [Roseateles amylovorans]UXH76860.1 TolC family protein [Roseateles amylovorans]